MKTFLKIRHFARLSVKRFARLCAQRLNDKAEKLSPFKKKIVLFVFCVSSSGISAYLIQQAILQKTVRNNTVFISRGLIPGHIGKTIDKKAYPRVSVADFNRLQLIKKYLDSIAVADKNGYAQIMKLRPHLVDSIRLLETFYLQNLKK